MMLPVSGIKLTNFFLSKLLESKHWNVNIQRYVIVFTEEIHTRYAF